MTRPSSNTESTAGFESILWAAADKLRGHMDSSEYKHVVLGLIFLKYISDAFTEQFDKIKNAFDKETAEDRDEYAADGVFWVPPLARWSWLQQNAKQPNIGALIDQAMEALENENPRQLKGVLPKDFGRPTLDKTKLGELIDLFANLQLIAKQTTPEDELFNAPNKTSSGKDLLGRVYEYFLSKFASSEGKLGGEFYTPGSVVRVIVEMLAPYKGRIYDPACGSGGMFVTSEKFVEAHGGKIGDVSIYGQESNPTTWKLAKMNLAIRGLEANLGTQNADTFHNNQHPDLRADYILANPPFNISDWGGERLRSDARWEHGAPPSGNANYAWMQHMLYHLAPNGIAGFVLANGSLSSNSSGEGEIRQHIIEADLVDCIVAMPGQLFYTTQIPVSLWFLAKNKKNGRGLEGRTLRDRKHHTLFIDARKFGYMETRVNRNFTNADIALIADTYHNWRGDGTGEYTDQPGFCKSASLEEIKSHGYVLTPGRYVGVEAQEEDTEPFAEKMQRLTQELHTQFAQSAKLEAQIKSNLKKLGYGQ